MTTAAERRARIADAAISTLAKEGMRGLTHRAVDQAAELPQGSCSYYFRTRQALLEATVARLFELDTAALTPVSPMPEQFDLDLLVDLMTGFVERAATVDRENLIARYELSLEATRRPELRATLVDIG
ncbi:MAG: TetR family transcriptional regulator, partial [Actinomycetota bacterium]|nr:TetR family transcriptional regulator [Actinomycetota bacterium]